MKRLVLCSALSLLLACYSAPQAKSLHEPITPAVRYEVRAVWLTTLMGLDWPQRPARTPESSAAQRADLVKMLDRLQAVGINTIFFQTRLRATTAYTSAIEPWSDVFTGQAGKAPDYDPLRFVIDECHQRGIELHAWVVAFPVGTSAANKQLRKRALPKRKPNLCMKCGDQWMMNPGVPETADYLAAICKEIVENYDVDGIHLDYIRYPEPAIPFNDRQTYLRYGGGKSLAVWRGENVDRCVQRVSQAVKAVRPWIKLSCSPVGKYADLPRYSSKGWNARDAVYQDAQKWLREGWMDWLCPMMYFDGNNFYPFLADWNEHAAGRLIVPGLGIYFLNPREKNWRLTVITRQLRVIRQEGTGGAAFFRAKFLLDNEKGLYDWLTHQYYTQPALVPPMTWADSIPPRTPHLEKRIEGNTLRLTWEKIAEDTPIYYNVYRLDSTYGDVLLARRLRDTHFEQLLTLPALKHSRYVVTAVDAYGNGSTPQSE